MRLREVLQALDACIRPTHLTRLGVRYVDRIKEHDFLQRIPTHFRAEVLGLASARDLAGQVEHCFSESLMATQEGRLLVRSGRLPANSTYDPILVGATPEESWILDLDSFNEGRKAFHVDAVMLEAQALAARAYAFFRWSITAAFMEQFG